MHFLAECTKLSPKLAYFNDSRAESAIRMYSCIAPTTKKPQLASAPSKLPPSS